MRWALNGSVAMNGREREGWEGVEGLQEGSKGLSYTDEWALASNHRVASLSNESEDATRKESTCKLIFTKRKAYFLVASSDSLLRDATRWLPANAHSSVYDNPFDPSCRRSTPSHPSLSFFYFYFYFYFFNIYIFF